MRCLSGSNGHCAQCCLSVRMNRSMTAMLPCRPTAPKRKRISAAPTLESRAVELAAFVADQMPGPGLGSARGMTEELTHSLAGGLSPKRGQTHDPPGEVIHDDGHPPAERPALREGQRRPSHPKSAHRRDRRQVDVPHVVGVIARDSVRFLASSCGSFSWRRPWMPFEHSSYRRGAQVESGASQGLGDFNLAHGGTKGAQPSH